LPVVASAHAAGADTWTEEGVTVHRVTGGANNALYRVETGGQRYACKLCVADERRRAAREYGALRLLHAAGLDIAPQPLWLDESCTILPFPTVVYRWLPGDPLGPSPTPQQLAALLEGYQNIHALCQRDYERFDLPTAWFHWFEFAPYLAELRGFLILRWLWSEHHGPDRVRLTQPALDAVEVRARLVRFIERAERFANSGRLISCTVSTTRH
jgi:Ser/Thr protein kinase RdoA (MazF antagonist)